MYHQLPGDVRTKADRQYEVLLTNPHHPSLHFKKVGSYWSARVDIGHRAVAVRDGDDLIWFWIGTHAAYDYLIRRTTP
jgi:hypothetical protein